MDSVRSLKSSTFLITAIFSFLADKLAVSAVVLDGNKIVFVVLRFGELDVEFRLVKRNLTRNVFRDMGHDCFMIFFSVLVPVRCRLDVLNDDPL